MYWIRFGNGNMLYVWVYIYIIFIKKVLKYFIIFIFKVYLKKIGRCWGVIRSCNDWFCRGICIRFYGLKLLKVLFNLIYLCIIF